eukprot:CAMPEP_0172572462 /NCGR_PEP_ID=MMETSP1067-20121228/135187_1 /TAXON_ID=265564 ORGANISM="Thalassiosira punctigera, Strain Tpunct2005C2" /NCGR_SAMPLE_ID=MMETSP1067 /ASSEMBLY_ACC=CAM_ASM_000444 /LENGTH=46 /DNA_ID= /DNA_START= /DNA_END= /DNA_ORIENTATION=
MSYFSGNAISVPTKKEPPGDAGGPSATSSSGGGGLGGVGPTNGGSG